jgi:ankyrin repeat protein
VNEPAENDSVACPEGVIYRAAENGHLEVVRWLLDQGAKVNFLVDGQVRCIALTRAIAGGYLDVVKLLAERGAEVNSRPAERTALDLALMYQQSDIADYLLSVGAKRAAELP